MSKRGRAAECGGPISTASHGGWLGQDDYLCHRFLRLFQIRSLSQCDPRAGYRCSYQPHIRSPLVGGVPISRVRAGKAQEDDTNL